MVLKGLERFSPFIELAFFDDSGEQLGSGLSWSLQAASGKLDSEDPRLRLKAMQSTNAILPQHGTPLSVQTTRRRGVSSSNG